MGLPMESNVPVRYSAYLAGGSTQANQSLARHLREVGIEVIGQALTDNDIGASLPISANVILILKDMISHNMSNKVYLLARKQGIKSIEAVAMSWAITRQKLERAGLVVVAPNPIMRSIDVAPKTTDKRSSAWDPKNNSHVARSQAIKALVKVVLDENKDRLEQYTNVELAEEVSKRLGETVHSGTVSNHRTDMGYKMPPKGYKRPRERRVIQQPIKPTAKVVVPGQTAIVFGTSSDPEPDIDVVQGLLAEIVKKHRLSKLYISFDNNEWDVNWDFVAIQSRSKKYK